MADPSPRCCMDNYACIQARAVKQRFAVVTTLRTDQYLGLTEVRTCSLKPALAVLCRGSIAHVQGRHRSTLPTNMHAVSNTDATTEPHGQQGLGLWCRFPMAT